MSNPKTKGSLRAWFWLVRSSRRIEHLMADRFRSKHNSSLTRFDVLSNLPDRCSAGITTTELSKQLMASKGNITRLLDRMESESLLIRKSSNNDRRVTNVYLEKKGAKLFKLLAQEHELWADEVFSVLTTKEQNTLVKLATKVFEQARSLENKKQA